MNNFKAIAQSAEAVWGKSYAKLAGVVNRLSLETGAEIGVAYGGNSVYLLKNTKVKKLYGVDPYKHFPDYDDPMNCDQDTFDEIYTFTSNRLGTYGKRYQLLRMLSTEAVAKISEPLDFVYIDAQHSFEGVMEDLGLWFGKVREGGVLAGHDYDHPNFLGVRQAVDIFFSRFGWEVHDEGEGVWWVEKQPLPISFIIPAYNAEKTLADSVASIIQTNLQKGDEIIIVDDCSTDKTYQVITRLAKKYPEIYSVQHTRNKGGGATRNTAVEHARNQLIFCLDADNLLAPDSIIPLKEKLITNGVDMAIFENLFYFSSTPKKITHKWSFLEQSLSLEAMLSMNQVPGASGNYLYTKIGWLKAGGYPEYVHHLDTWGFSWRQLVSGQVFTILPDSTYFHRHGHQSYWVRTSSEYNTSLLALQIVIPNYKLIFSEDFDYIMSPTKRMLWFEEREVRPVRLANIERELTLLNKVRRLFQ